MSIQKVLINEKTIQERTRQLAEEITEDYQGKKITLICILKGSIFFFTDLTRRINLDTELEFVRISSYAGENSTGDINLKVDLDNPVTGKDVIVIEDIIDTGRTLSYFMKHLEKQKPNSLRLCTLLDKPERREVDDVKVDYTGFTIPNRFVIGYGLDLDEQYRTIPQINCIINEDEEKQIDKDSRVIKKQLLKKD
ncbi:MAG: hypoxanthine phosphoribosyltransferase [Bacilli bacterium]|nr:hypoxanthine phosphoribosyltransferase [Bacilli bacterium]